MAKTIEQITQDAVAARDQMQAEVDRMTAAIVALGGGQPNKVQAVTPLVRTGSGNVNVESTRLGAPPKLAGKKVKTNRRSKPAQGNVSEGYLKTTLAYLVANPGATIQDVVKASQKSRTYAHNALRRLVAEKRIVRTRDGRNWRYAPA